MRRISLVLACLLASAGCIGVAGEEADSGATGAVDDASSVDVEADDPSTGAAPDRPENATVGPPTWEVGDWWTYRFEGSESDREVTFAVADADNGSYTLLVDDREHAIFDAVFGDLPYVGEVAREDLSGTQDGTTVRLFTWPLEDGKTWTTEWNRKQRSIEVQAAAVHEAGDEKTDGFHLTARTDSDTFAEYTYAPTVGWFTKLSFPGLGISYTLIEYGSSYGGELVEASGEKVYEAPDVPADAATFAVDEDAELVAVEAGGGGPARGQQVQLVAPNGTTYGVGRAPCQGCFEVDTAVIPAEAGDWAIARAGVDAPEPAPVHAWASTWTVQLDTLQLSQASE